MPSLSGWCLPWFMRPRFPPQVQIEAVRRRMTRFAHLIPPPPRGTEVIAVDAGGVKASASRRLAHFTTDTRRLCVRLSGAVPRFYLAHSRRGQRPGVMHRLSACPRTSVSGARFSQALFVFGEIRAAHGGELWGAVPVAAIARMASTSSLRAPAGGALVRPSSSRPRRSRRNPACTPPHRPVPRPGPRRADTETGNGVISRSRQRCKPKSVPSSAAIAPGLAWRSSTSPTLMPRS